MKVEPLAPFVCPLDGLPLLASAAGLACENGHRYDRAREGYVNLLPAQHKASRDPGDDKTMVAARRRIAEAGHFRALSDALFVWLREYSSGACLRVVDAGCGEGYALDALTVRAQLSDDQGTLQLAGYDISKWAVRAAARRSQAVAWAVASNRQPPLAAASVDVLLSLFGFAHWPAFEALLAPAGRLVTVDAEADHLLELREIIYPEVVMSGAEPAPEAVQRGWRVHRAQPLRYQINLASTPAITDLVAMTPHAHRITSAGRAALTAHTHLAVTMSMMMREWLPPDRA